MWPCANLYHREPPLPEHDWAVQVIMLPMVYGAMSFKSVMRMWMVFTGAFGSAEEIPNFNHRVKALTDVYDSNFTVADLYEAWALYAFGTLCIEYVGLKRSTLGDLGMVKPLQQILLSGIMVFVVVTAAQSFLKLGIGFAESTVGIDICAAYPEVCRLDGPFQGAGFVASSVAIWDIMIVEREFHGDMTEFRPGLKFLATKALVSLAFMQSILLAVANIFLGRGLSTPQQNLLYSSMICIEVFVISLLHVAAWNPGAKWYEKMQDMKMKVRELESTPYVRL